MLEFNEQRHEYTLGGAVLPSVTQIIKSAGLIDTTFFDEYSCRRGTAVHLATELYDEGTLDETTVAEEIKGYLDGWKRFLKESGFKTLTIEHKCSHPIYGYAGMIDRVGLLNNASVILDLKTGVLNPAVGVQLAAYKELETIDVPLKTYALQLNYEGTYKLKEYNDRADWTAFLSCLNLFNWKKNKGVK